LLASCNEWNIPQSTRLLCGLWCLGAWLTSVLLMVEGRRRRQQYHTHKHTTTTIFGSGNGHLCCLLFVTLI
jgi:hypothetical protein